MAKKPVFVFSSPSGSPGGNDGVTFVATYGVGVLLRDPVYLSGANQVDRADASSAATMRVAGIVSTIDFPGIGQCVVTRNGSVTGFAGLIPGSTYLMSTTPGTILPEGSGDPAFPSATGEVAQTVGEALDATTLVVDCSSSELLLP